MVGKMIPKVTVYHFGKTITKTKEPLYKLRSAEEEKAYQDKLGKSVSFWYGTWCEKCCGVYPRFYTEQDFEAKGYYVCLVCGKESRHCHMNHQAKDAWNNREYLFVPSGYQYSLFDN